MVEGEGSTSEADRQITSAPFDHSGTPQFRNTYLELAMGPNPQPADYKSLLYL